MRRFGALALSTALAMVACSSFSDGSAPAPFDEGGAESGTTESGTDAPVDAGPADTGDDAVVNLLVNAGFESGCGGWAQNGATVADETMPSLVHGGTKSCRVCGKDGGPPYYFTQRAVVDVPVGAEYMAEAWVRAVPGVAAPILSRRIDLYASDGGAINIGSLSDTAVTGAFAAVTDFTKVTTGAAAIQLTFRVSDPATCFVVDDAVLYRSK